MTDILFVVLFYVIAVLTGVSIKGLLNNLKIRKIMKRTNLELEVFSEVKDKLTEEEKREAMSRIDGRLAVTKELLK